MMGDSVLSSKAILEKVITEEEYKNLKEIARRVRIKIIKMLTKAGSGHPGGSLSIVEILVSLYFHLMKHDPHKPDWKKRDRLVLSKGHGCPALYAVLCEAGYFKKEHLATLRKWGSILQGHPDRLLTPGVEMSTGSLGQGLSVSTGMAIAAKLSNDDVRIYALCSDGEQQSGMTWEAAMSAAKHKLDNLTVFLDYNRLQIDGPNKEIMPINPIVDKYIAFGWNVIRIDGHDFRAIIAAAGEAAAFKGKPTIIVCDTVKGKGVSFMENQVKWHGVAPTEEEAAMALKELGEADND